MDLNTFTHKAQQAVQAAAGDARARHHQATGTEHLLLALLGQSEGLVYPLLSRLEVDPAALRRALGEALDKIPRVFGGTATAVLTAAPSVGTATFAGVFPTATALNLALGPTLRSWNFILGNAVFNLCVVALLTWIVMPLLTRALHGWLHPEEGKARP